MLCKTQALGARASRFWIVCAVILVVCTSVFAQTVNLTSTDTSAAPTPGEVQQRLVARLESLRDLQAVVSLKAFDAATGTAVNDAEVELLAVLPSVVRVNVRLPELFRGDAFVLDQAANEGYTYSAVHDLAQCQRLDQFYANLRLPRLPNLEDLFMIPNGGTWTDIETVGWDTLDGGEVLVLRVRPSERAEEVLEEGLGDIEESLRDAGLAVDVDLEDVLYIWVDLELEIIRQMKVFNADGALLVSVEAKDIRLDQGLSVSSLKSFRGAEIRRCR